MDKRIFIVGFVMILFASFASAAVNDAYFYYSLDDADLTGSDPDDVSGNGRDGTNLGGATTGVTGKLNQAFDFEGTDDRIQSNTISRTTAGSVCGWYNFDSVSIEGMFDFSTDGTINNNQLYCYVSSGQVVCGLRVGATKQWEFTTNAAVISQDTWHHVCLVQDGVEAELYVDNTDVVKSFGVSTDKTAWTTDLNGADISASYYMFFNNVYSDGTADELIYYENAKSPSDISTLWNSGNGFNPYAETPFALTLNNIYNSSNVLIFNASITNSTGVFNFSTTNGTIITPRYGQLVDIDIDSLTYLDVSYEDINTSSDFEADIWQSELRVIVNDSVFITNIGSFNITIDDGVITSSNNSVTEAFFKLNADTYSYDVFKDGYPDDSGTFVITAQAKQNETVGMAKSLNNIIIFQDQRDMLPINLANITVIYPSGEHINLTTNSSGQINFSTIHKGITEEGTIQLVFSSYTGFISPVTFTTELNVNTYPLNDTFFVSDTNIIVNIYDRVTRDLLDGVEVSLFIIGSTNRTTTNGTIVIEDLSLSAGDYTFVTTADGYSTEQRTLIFTGQENLTVDFYMLNLTDPNAGTAFANVFNEFFITLPDAQVILLEYDPVLLEYTEISECYTNNNGECSFAVEIGVKKYQLVGQKIVQGELLIDRTSDKGQFIDVDNDIIPLFLKFTSGFIVSDFTGLSLSLSENVEDLNDKLTNTSSINATFNNEDGQTTTVCIDYYRLESDNQTLISSTCVNSAAGTVATSETLNRSFEHRVDVYQLSTGYKIVFFKENINKQFSLQDLLNQEELLPTFVIVPVLVLLALTFWLRKIIIFSIGVPVVVWAEVALFPSIFFAEIAVLITFMCGLLLRTSIRKRSDPK